MDLKFSWKKKSKPASRAELQALAFMFENGLRAGRDVGSILKSYLRFHPSSVVALRIERGLNVEGLDSLESVQAGDALENILYKMLSKSKTGAPSLSRLMRSYRMLIQVADTLEQKQRSLTFIPRFQATIILLLAGVLGMLIPSLLPEIFPSFLSLGRWDLFISGWAVMGMGLLMLRWLCQKPQKHLLSAMNSCLFFQSLALHLSSGMDFIGSWSAAYEGLRGLSAELSATDAKFQTQSDFVLNKLKIAPPIWRPILAQLPWLLELGNGLGDFLEESSFELMRWFEQKWDEDLRRMSAFAILPLGLFVFPAALFLMVGPRVLEILG